MGVRHSVIGLVEILKWMQEQGHSRDSLLKDTGLDDARLGDPKATVVPTEELQFYQNLRSLSDNPHILLEAGFQLKLATYGVWGLALISSPTLGKAIELGIQFIDFSYTYNQIISFEDGDQAGIRISQAEELGDLQEPMIERDISAAFVLIQVLLQTEHPMDEIRFAWPSRLPQDYYESLFGCRVLFEQEYNELRMAKTSMDHELPQHNSMAVELCKGQLEQIRPDLRVADGIVERVQHYLSSMPLYRTSMEDCAESMNMSSRNLRRKLTEQGQSYQSLLDGFRFLLAKKYLGSTNMTLDEIAERLGYSDAANFSHAFKRWSGQAPRRVSQGE